MRRVLFAGIMLILVGVITLVGFFAWLACSSAGARWLVQMADDIAGIEVSVESLEGSLIDELQIENLLVSWDDGQFLLGSLHYDIRSLGIFPARIELNTFEAEQPILRVGDKESTEESEPVGIEIIPDWLDAKITTLRITDFFYQGLNDHDDRVVIAHLIAGSYQLTGDRLSAQGFSYHSPYVHLDGDFEWDLARPHLVMEAQVFLPETVVDPELFDAIRVPVDFPGRIEVDGDWNHYVGPARFGSVDTSGDVVWLTARLDGSWSGIRIENLKGGYLLGSVAGNLDMTWIDDYRLQGSVAGVELNLSELEEALDGRSTFDVTGELYVPYNDNPMESRLDADISDSHLRGHPLHGRAAGEWLGTSLMALDLDLVGTGSHLMARGTVAERVDVDVNVEDLTQLYPDLQGKVVAQGWLRRVGDSLTGEVAGSGENLSWQELSVESILFQGSHLVAGEAISVEIDGQNWRYGEWHLESGLAFLSGDTESHRLALEVEGPAGHVEAELNGHYQNANWLGTIDRLSGLDMPWGNWSMPQATQLAWQESALSFSNLQLLSDHGGQITVTVADWGGETNSNYHLDWNDFPLDWLKGDLGMNQFSGMSSGDLNYEVLDSQPHVLQGNITASGRAEDEMYDFAYEELAAEFSWTGEGLLLASAIETAASETLTADIISNQPPQWSWPPKDLVVDLKWHGLNLARINRFLDSETLEGTSDGDAHLEIVDSEPVRIGLHTSVDGRILEDENELGPRSLEVNLHWSDTQFRCAAQIEGMLGGSAWLNLTSAEDPTLSWPDSGNIDLQIEGLNLATLEPLIAEGIDFTGRFVGEAEGSWFEKERFSLNGSLRLDESQLLWESNGGQVRVPIRNALSDWQWQDEVFSGSWEMDIAQHSYLQGEWSLPFSARIPLQLNRDKPLQATLDGHLETLGSLSAVGPWLVQELTGELEARFKMDGTWNEPALSGNLEFKDGGAYLPVAGIQLEDMKVQAELEGSQVHFKHLGLRSDTGNLTGYGTLTLEPWNLVSYELNIAGEEFQLLNFPELNLLIDPDLVFSGTPQSFSMKGTVHVPTLAIRGSQLAQGVQPSKDIEIATTETSREELSFETDVRVVVSLGEDVTVVTSGVDTRLEGSGVVTMSPEGEMLAWGEINLVSGTYQGYGARMKIRQGLLQYKGDPIINPDLKIFAAREVGTVLAGVQITGTGEVPVVTLYSRPAMPERDIIGYIFMGRPMGTDSQDSDMVGLSAGALLSGPGGASVIDLHGLHVGSEGVRIRKRLAEKWEVESTLGSDSALDLFYVIEFD